MSQSKKEVSVSAYKALGLKVKKLEENTKDLRSEGRKLRKRIKSLESSREGWKGKAVSRQEKCKVLEKKFLRQTKTVKPKRHHYPIWLITLVVNLQIYCHCSYGNIRKVLELLQKD